MLYQVDDALLHAMSGIELSRVRTELRLLLPEAYQQKSDRVERADIVMQSSENVQSWQPKSATSAYSPTRCKRT